MRKELIYHYLFRFSILILTFRVSSVKVKTTHTHKENNITSVLPLETKQFFLQLIWLPNTNNIIFYQVRCELQPLASSECHSTQLWRIIHMPNKTNEKPNRLNKFSVDHNIL